MSVHRITVGFDWTKDLGDHVTLEVYGAGEDEPFRVPFDQVRDVAEAMLAVLDDDSFPGGAA